MKTHQAAPSNAARIRYSAKPDGRINPARPGHPSTAAAAAKIKPLTHATNSGGNDETK